MVTDLPTRLRALPALRRLAEEQAREQYETYRHMNAPWGPELSERFDDIDPEDREADVATHLALLCDLTRPASAEAIKRLIAGATDIDPRGGLLFAYAPERRPDATASWTLQGTQRHRALVVTDWWPEFDETGPMPTWERNRRVALRDLPTDPAIALATIALAVLGGDGEAG